MVVFLVLDATIRRIHKHSDGVCELDGERLQAENPIMNAEHIDFPVDFITYYISCFYVPDNIE